jgi:hypothetical protein
MAVQVPSFLVPVQDLPKPDISWLDSLSQAGGDLIGHVSQNKAFGRLDKEFDRQLGGPPSGVPQGSFLSNLIGGNQQQAPASPAAPVSRAAVPNQPPIPGIQRQTGPMDGYRNAIASIESAGSGDYAAVGPRHPKLGRALGRYQVMEANIGPWSQEVLGRTVTPDEFMSNPQLQDQIFDGKFQQYVQKFGPEGAAQAWFGGPGGVGQLNRQDSLGTSIAEYTSKFNNAMGASGGAVDAVNAMGEGGTVPGYVDPMVSAPNSRQQAAAQPMPQGMPVNQMADASGNVLAPAVTPLGRGEVPSDLIRFMLRDPQLREMGKQLWQQNAGKSAGSEWDFAKLDDGTLVRQNKQTGAIERVGNFAKPQEAPNSYQEFQLAQREGFQGTYADWQKVKSPGTSVTVNNGEGDKFYENLDKKNAETFSALSETGMQARSKLAQVDQLEQLMLNAPQGAIGALKLAAGEYGINTEGLSDIQAAQALINELVPQQRQPGSGPMSDADLALFKQSLPRILNQPEGNQIIIQTMRGISQYNMQMGEIADKVADREITPAEGRKRIRELQNPLANLRSTLKQSAPPPEAGPVQIQTVDDYQNLPSGTQYIDPNGKLRTKQ